MRTEEELKKEWVKEELAKEWLADRGELAGADIDNKERIAFLEGYDQGFDEGYNAGYEATTTKWMKGSLPEEGIEVLCYRKEWDDYRVCKLRNGFFILSGAGTKYGKDEITEWAYLGKRI